MNILPLVLSISTMALLGCAALEKVVSPSPTDEELRCVEFGGTFISGPITPSHVCVLELTGPADSGLMTIPEPR